MTDEANAPTVPESSAPAPRACSPPTSPDGRYELRTLLGRGGMGEVWLAHDPRVDRELAVKLVRGGGSTDPDAIARFLREARVQGRLEHPSIVPVHDLGEDDTAPYFAMKRLTGITLAGVLARGDHEAWPRRTLLARFVDVCLAVEFAHQRGVIHRDIKPANIMLGDFGEAYLLDWGLARIADVADPAGSAGGPTDSGSGQTVAGAMLGTLGYMSPEQIRGEAVDRRTDVFALGCVLFEILTGTPAVPREQAVEATLAAACHRPAERAADVPPELDEACARATAAELAGRLPSARALADEVQRFLDGDRDLERRRALAEVHARRAQELLARGDDASHAEAMREAGSAIALDAGNRDAHAVLARLLLEPPGQTPAEVHAKITEERGHAGQKMLRNGALVYLAFFLLLPIARMLGVEGDPAFLAIGAPIVTLFAICAVGWWRRLPLTTTLAIAVLVIHIILITIVGLVFGPVLVLPILLFGSLPIMLLVPTVRMPITIFGLHMLAFAIPLLGERIGVLPTSYRMVDGAVVLTPWAITVTAEALVVVLGFVVFAQMLGNTLIVHDHRKNQERAQEQLHVQAWRLRQLVRR
jgi:eukaryotic-like serine/threonine-protein kinase